MRLRIYKYAICAGSQILSLVKNLESERGSFTADPVSALPTTPGIFSTNSSSSPRCLLDVCLDLWGFEEAIGCKQQSVECMCGEILILVPSAFGDKYLFQGTEGR